MRVINSTLVQRTRPRTLKGSCHRIGQWSEHHDWKDMDAAMGPTTSIAALRDFRIMC